MQHTDISGSPYFDDYSADKNFHRVLFKPGRSVQTRELQAIQSYMIEQNSRIGSHLFVEGSVVIPGGINVLDQQTGIKFTYPLSSTVDLTTVTGPLYLKSITTNQTAVVQKVFVEGLNNYIFCDYLNSGNTNDGSQVFDASDKVLVLSDINDPLSLIVTLTVVTPTKGSWVKVLSGVYYTRGFYVRTDDQSVVINPESTVDSASVGFNIIEHIVNELEDETLYSNASGHVNYKAPGASRLKITLELVKKALSSITNDDYIELVRYENGITQKKVDQTQYSELAKTLAQRTFEESGNYVVEDFQIAIHDHLKNANHVDGLYLAPPSGIGDADKYVVQVKPGIGYVNGYRVQNIGVIPVESYKARRIEDQKLVQNIVVSSRYGSYIQVRELTSVPTLDENRLCIAYHDTFNPSNYIATFRIRAIKYAGLVTSYDPATGPGRAPVTEPTYNVYIYDIQYQNGFTSLATTDGQHTHIHYSDLSEVIEGVVSYPAPINDGSFNLPIFKLPYSGVKSLEPSGSTDTTYTVQRSFEATVTGGVISLSLTTVDELFTSYSAQDYIISEKTTTSYPPTTYFAGYPTVTPTLTGSPSGRGITLSASITDGTHTRTIANGTVVKIMAPVLKQVSTKRVKTLLTATETLVYGANEATKPLAHTDIYKITSITTSIDLATDVSNTIVLNNGQRDNWYEPGSITRNDSTNPVTLIVEYQYFSHSSGDYFSIDSYAGMNREDIPTYQSNGTTYVLADCLDFRQDKNGSNTFVSTGELVQPNDNIRCDLYYYLPRYDSIYVDQNGKFYIVNGISSDNPIVPAVPVDTMRLYNLYVPPYTDDVNKILVFEIDNRRYTMRDIGSLDKRISNLEYYTSLSLLESKTNNINVLDASGNVRFKNGFAADGFYDYKLSDVYDINWSAALDTVNGRLLCQPYRDAIDLVYDSGSSSGITEKSNSFTLSYTEATEVEQPYATSSVNINPYAVFVWLGKVDITPVSDFWHDTKFNSPTVRNITIDNTNGSNGGTSDLILSNSTWNERSVYKKGHTRGGKGVAADLITTFTKQTSLKINSVVDTSVNSVSSTELVNSNVVIPYMRAINISFTLSGFKPFTKLYPFFNNIDVTEFCQQTGAALGVGIITDGLGGATGTFYVPSTSTNRFKTGKAIFRFSDSATNSYDTSAISTYGETVFISGGTLDEYNTNTTYTTTRNLITQTSISSGGSKVASKIVYFDPVAQSFTIKQQGGMYLSSLDLYFKSKSANVPVIVQIRTVENGIPTNLILPSSYVVLSPASVNVSSDGTVATNVVFDDLIYLSDSQEYAIVLISNSQDYEVFVAELGKGTLVGNYAVSQQPYAGVFFTSSNGSTWTPNQLMDLKFKLNRAVFGSSATLVFKNTAPDYRILDVNPLQSLGGVNPNIYVKCKSHGLKTGDTVTLANLVDGNGLTASQLNTTHVVTVDDWNVDVFYFTVPGVIPSSAGWFGGSNGIAYVNIPFTSLVQNIEPYSPNGTTVSYTMSYTDSSSRAVITNNSIDIKTFTELDTEGVVATNGDYTLTVNLSSSNTNLSPYIDKSGITTELMCNRINYHNTSMPIFTYVTKNLIFNNPTSLVKIYIGVLLPGSSEMSLYYKPLSNSDDDLTSVNWVEIKPTLPVTNDDTNFREYEYVMEDNINALNNFKTCIGFKFALGFWAKSRVDAPEVADFRLIALA